jgi:hypothetical protein
VAPEGQLAQGTLAEEMVLTAMMIGRTTTKSTAMTASIEATLHHCTH